MVLFQMLVELVLAFGFNGTRNRLLMHVLR